MKVFEQSIYFYASKHRSKWTGLIVSQENYFFLIFFLTILLTRVVIYFKPIASPTIGNFRVHHYMYGVVLVVISLLMKNITLYAIGLGLFVDELTYLFMRGKTHADNYSVASLVGTLLFIVLVLFSRYHVFWIPAFAGMT